MPKQQLLWSSLLDKLNAENFGENYEFLLSYSQRVTNYYESVRCDLENLLNTRITDLSWPDTWRELKNSLLTYGIPDVAPISANNQFCKTIADIILRFEPRFKAVQVYLIEQNEDHNAVLHLRIEALFCNDVIPEAVFFDSILEQGTNKFSFK